MRWRAAGMACLIAGAFAIAGLVFYKQDSTLKGRLSKAVETNGAASVREAFAKEFR